MYNWFVLHNVPPCDIQQNTCVHRVCFDIVKSVLVCGWLTILKIAAGGMLHTLCTPAHTFICIVNMLWCVYNISCTFHGNPGLNMQLRE